MTRKQKKMLVRIIVASVLFAALAVLPLALPESVAASRAWFWVSTALYAVTYLVIGYDILRKAFKGIVNGQVFDECFLMVVATLGAIGIAVYEKSGDFKEAVAVMLFYQIGEFFQSYAVGKSRRNIMQLMDIRPDYANVKTDGSGSSSGFGADGSCGTSSAGGGLKKVSPDEVAVGTVIVVQPGEKIPIDGVVVCGASTVNTSALTGESLPREVAVGGEVISGCINLTGVLEIRTTKAFGESTVSKILALVEESSSRKSRSENFITKFARVYTPAVCGAALALAVLPPVVRLLLGSAPLWSQWVYRALTFLVISCPCALVISIPLSFFAGIGCASRDGILIKGSNYLETLSEVTTVVFDKTGTLTRGVFEVVGVHHSPLEDEKLLEYAAHAECASSHPISKSLQEAYGKPVDRARVTDIEEIAGHGITAKVDGVTVACGNEKLMERLGVQALPCHHVGTIIHVAVADGAAQAGTALGTDVPAHLVYMGHIVISDVEKPTAREALAALKKAGVQKTVMLTGDAVPVAEQVGKSLGVDEVHGGLLPQDKVQWVEHLLAAQSGSVGSPLPDSQRSFQRCIEGSGTGTSLAGAGLASGTASAQAGTAQGAQAGTAQGAGKLAFVGDGINDAPVLGRADIGIAMGAMGSDAAIEAADVVLMDDDPLRIARGIKISRKCLGIVHENIVFALGVKAACLALGAAGIANMWLAIFADVGVMVLAVLNAIRALRIR